VFGCIPVLLEQATSNVHMIEILQMREGMWASTAARVKTLQKVYPFGLGADEFMTYGFEDCTFKDGRKASVCFLIMLYALPIRS
jgi:hypothetical protein